MKYLKVIFHLKSKERRKVEKENNLKVLFSFWFKAIRLLIFMKFKRPKCRKFVRVCLLQSRATGEKNEQKIIFHTYHQYVTNCWWQRRDFSHVLKFPLASLPSDFFFFIIILKVTSILLIK